jgi:hypothetical protein
VKADSPQRRSCNSTADPDCQHIEENNRLKKEIEDLKRQLQAQEEVKEERSKRRSRSHAYFDLSRANPKPAKQLSRNLHPACFEIPYEELEFLGDQIGKGGYGTVYRTRWRGTVIAVKKLRIDMPVPADKYAEFLSNCYNRCVPGDGITAASEYCDVPGSVYEASEFVYYIGILLERVAVGSAARPKYPIALVSPL